MTAAAGVLPRMRIRCCQCCIVLPCERRHARRRGEASRGQASRGASWRWPASAHHFPCCCCQPFHYGGGVGGGGGGFYNASKLLALE